jgi:hypothetical protein
MRIRILQVIIIGICLSCLPEIMFSAIITGNVYDDASLLPISGATIKSYSSFTLVYSTMSDSSGNYNLILSSGVYNITANKTGYFDKTYNNVPVIAGLNTVRNIELKEIVTGTLSGKTTNIDSGNNVSAARIEISQFSVLKASASADASGNYSITISTGTYDIKAVAGGYNDYIQTGINIFKNQTTQCNIALKYAAFKSDSVMLSNTVFNTVSQASFPIEVQLTADSQVKAMVITASGMLIRALCNEPKPSGLNIIYWDGRDEAGNKAGSGMYIVNVKTNKSNILKKIVVIN